MGRLALQLPTNEPNFTIERFENGYYRISGISLQTIQINLNEMMQTASTAPVTNTALRQPVPRGRRKVHAISETPAPMRKKRKLSAAGRQAIAAAQKKRWANKKREEKTMAAGG